MLAVCPPLLRLEHQPLRVKEAGEGLRRDLLHPKTVIFQVQRRQSGGGVAGVTDVPLLQRPARRHVKKAALG